MRQFEATTQFNRKRGEEDTTFLITALQGQAAEVLQGVPAEVNYGDIVAALEGRYGQHNLAAIYRCELRGRTQKSGESLQEFTMIIEQLVQRELVGLPLEFVQEEAAHTFIEGLRDADTMKHLLLWSAKTVSDPLAQALRLEATGALCHRSSRLEGWY